MSMQGNIKCDKIRRFDKRFSCWQLMRVCEVFVRLAGNADLLIGKPEVRIASHIGSSLWACTRSLKHAFRDAMEDEK